MTPQILTELARYPMFPESARTLIRVGGLDAAAALISAWPGQDVPMPKVPGGLTAAGKALWQKLVDVVGASPAEAFVNHFQGEDMAVPNLKEVIHQRVQQVIRLRFDEMVTTGGLSCRVAVFELGVEHNLSRKAIEKILKRPSIEITPISTAMVSAPVARPKKIVIRAENDGQGLLF